MVKSQVLIYMYDLLINKNEIVKEEIIAEFNITDRTFRRYISEINCFFDNFYKNQTIVYDKEKHIYKLDK